MKKLQYAVIIVLSLSVSLFTHASLLVTPQRIVFGERDRAQQVVLINPTNQTRSYRLEWQQQQQVEGGGYRTLKQGDANGRKTVDDIVRFSPRQVRLGPGERQVVKLLARRSANMQAGEYRSHLLFSALPLPQSSEIEQVDGMKMQVNVLVSYSIPVLLNVDYELPQVSISDIKVTPRPDNHSKFADVNVSLQKNGDFGAIGKIKAYYKPRSSDTFEQVAILNNVSIYAEAQAYTGILSWQNAPLELGGELKIRYEGDAELSGISFDEQSISLSL